MNKRLGETNKEFAARIRSTTAQMMEDQTRRVTTRTGKEAAFTVTVKTASSVESFFFYDMEELGDILYAIHRAQNR